MIIRCPSPQSPVMSARFSRFHPSYVIGGTYSGQIVLWDTRASRRTPVQRSPLSSSAHTHPVYCLDVVGSQNAHNLISISTDGKLCSWNLDMLSQPQVWECDLLGMCTSSWYGNVTCWARVLAHDIGLQVVCVSCPFTSQCKANNEQAHVHPRVPSAYPEGIYIDCDYKAILSIVITKP